MEKNKTPPEPPVNNGDTKVQGSPATASDQSPGNPPSSPADTNPGTASGKTAASKAVEKASPASSSASVKAPVKKKGSAVKAFAWLVVIVALLAAAYFLWPHYGEQLRATYLPGDSSASGVSDDRTSTQPQALDAPDAGQSAPASTDTVVAAALEEEIRARQALEEQLSGQIADLQLRLNSYDDRLRSLSTTSREDWLLAEAEYLLRLANQRILTERQSVNALALMESADSILRDFNDSELFAVRRALAQDITRVRMVAAVDREGIYLRLGALVEAVDQLDSLLPEPPAPAEAEAAEVDAAPAPWYRRLLDNARQALVKMTGLVRIERRDVPLEPLLTQEQEQILRHNLKVVLEQARLALLREEQGIYAASLNRAASWVTENFESDAVSKVFVDEIAELKQQSVVQELPSLSASIRGLQEYIRLWHNRYAANPAADVEQQESTPGPDPVEADADAEDLQ
ncbi:MAG: hypothetical protein VR73_02175 [Gammaproteobacteria bacterium BRH_c0]|nr:MAG: hypothetical protein VR73_02175 [Gammaproteobacteria bacterium BRH_c0]